RVDAGGRELLAGEARDQLAAGEERVPQRVDVGGAREAPGHADDGDRPRRVVRRADRARVLRGRGLVVAAAAEVLGEAADGRVAEQVDDADGAPEPALDAGADLGEQERVAAEVEEAVVEADVVEAQHLAPDGGELLLERRAWRLADARASAQIAGA